MGQPNLRIWMIWGHDLAVAATALDHGESTSSPAASLGAGLGSSHASMGAAIAAESAGVDAGTVVVAVETAVESAAPAFAIAAIEAYGQKRKVLELNPCALARITTQRTCRRFPKGYLASSLSLHIPPRISQRNLYTAIYPTESLRHPATANMGQSSGRIPLNVVQEKNLEYNRTAPIRPRTGPPSLAYICLQESAVQLEELPPFRRAVSPTDHLVYTAADQLMGKDLGSRVGSPQPQDIQAIVAVILSATSTGSTTGLAQDLYFTCETVGCGARLVLKEGKINGSGELLQDCIVSQTLTSSAVKIEEFRSEPTASTAEEERSPEDQIRTESLVRKAGRAMKSSLGRLKRSRSKNAVASSEGKQTLASKQMRRSRDKLNWRCHTVVNKSSTLTCYDGTSSTTTTARGVLTNEAAS
ncbi:hypothetical protein SVAN01_00291 [Stagonosporopsis vannaccii]|nr:hypothetical protein SVAN01_00291 [Stagonosporopsis vannaccii]